VAALAAFADESGINIGCYCVYISHKFALSSA
jgi:hypothetical protein